MPWALKNAPAKGPSRMAKNEYLAKAFTLLSLGTSSKQYLRPMAAISTSTVLPGMNQAIELSGTPARRSAAANPTKEAGIITTQNLTGTSNSPATRIAQPGQSGHTVCGFETSIPTRVGMRYDRAMVTHATSKAERESKYGLLSNRRLLKFVMRASPHREARSSDEIVSEYTPFGLRYRRPTINLFRMNAGQHSCSLTGLVKAGNASGDPITIPSPVFTA